MRTHRQSDLAWLGLALLLFWKRRKRRKHGTHREPGSHRIPDVLSLTQLRELAAAAGMADANTGAAIAMAESSGRVKAVGDNGRSIGLWQINLDSCPKQWANADMLKDAGFNAQAAASMSNGGTNWEPWTTFRNGVYKKYLSTGK